MFESSISLLSTHLRSSHTTSMCLDFTVLLDQGAAWATPVAQAINASITFNTVLLSNFTTVNRTAAQWEAAPHAAVSTASFTSHDFLGFSIKDTGAAPGHHARIHVAEAVTESKFPFSTF